MKKVTPCLWFDNEAEDAANFYVSIFPNSKILEVERYSVDTPSDKPMGSVMTVTYSLNGNEFMALNGGTFFKISEAVSFMIDCADQKELDYYYEKLSSDPNAEVCGWLKDKFGVSWQLIPVRFAELMKTASDEKKPKIMQALMQMKRLNIAELEKAAN